MKLEVGMYVRTPYGIRKIVNITKDDGYKPRVKVIEFDRILNTTYKMDYIFYTDEHTIKKSKASHNIGELLEVGDFIDKFYISDIKGTTIYTEIGWFIDFEDVEDLVTTICTKEQFESISYKVGE